MIGAKGDTLNCTDNSSLKQGKWVNRVESVRGEPGYEEEGVYKDGAKTGMWRTYTLMGDIMAVENFRFGFKDGICNYYNLNGLVRQESWKAIDPKNPYDTVDVYDVNNTDVVTKKIVRVELSSIKQGTWIFYNPVTGAISKQEEYILNQLVDPATKKVAGVTDSTNTKDSTVNNTAKAKPPEVVQYEKKNAKKKIKVRDGATGVPLKN